MCVWWSANKQRRLQHCLNCVFFFHIITINLGNCGRNEMNQFFKEVLAFLSIFFVPGFVFSFRWLFLQMGSAHTHTQSDTDTVVPFNYYLFWFFVVFGLFLLSSSFFFWSNFLLFTEIAAATAAASNLCG